MNHQVNNFYKQNIENIVQIFKLLKLDVLIIN